jgi:amino acid permease
MDLNLGQLVVKTIILQVIFVVAKVAFFSYFNIELWPITVLFYVIIAAASIGVVRRFGDINYFESFLILIIWIVVGLLVDLTITSKLVGDDFWTNRHQWFSYLTMILAVLIFDRKEHVALRKAAK